MTGTVRPETTSRVNRVLDFAERQGWWPFLTGALTGFAVLSLVQGFWPAWAFLAAGLTMTAVRPAATSARRRLLVRDARRAVAARRSRG
jgi:hypothetical protein